MHVSPEEQAILAELAEIEETEDYRTMDARRSDPGVAGVIDKGLVVVEQESYGDVLIRLSAAGYDTLDRMGNPRGSHRGVVTALVVAGGLAAGFGLGKLAFTLLSSPRGTSGAPTTTTAWRA